MSTCIFDSILDHNGGAQVTVSGPHPERLSHFASRGAEVTADNVKAASDGDIVFLGVKPQVLTGVLQELANHHVDFKSKILITMAAGYRCASIIAHTGSERLVRIMPNTPAKIGLGVIGAYYCRGVSAQDREAVEPLIANLGLVIEAKSEDEINAIGVVAGCAPAYLFRFMEAMIANSVKLGISAEDARSIAEQVFIGSATLAGRSHDRSVAQLREAVTSKGGTTYEGLKVMTELDFDGLVAKTVEASMRRTSELEQMF